MRVMLIALMVVCGLSGCQSIPAERKNNCACNWEVLETQTEGSVV